MRASDCEVNMTDIVYRDQLQALAEERQKICISIFMPLMDVGRQVQQNPIRLKNLLGAAEQKMLAMNFTPVKAREILAPARRLVERDDFWRTEPDGLALYLPRAHSGISSFRWSSRSA